MPTPTTINANLVIAKDNANYEVHSFTPTKQAQLTQAVSDIAAIKTELDTKIQAVSALPTTPNIGTMYLVYNAE